MPEAPSETVTLADLSERQAAFVREYVERGGRPGAAADAAVSAGYARPGPEGRAAARVRASELLRNEKVLRFLRDELTRKLNAGAALGVAALLDLAQNAKSEQVRLSAANSLIDRGHGPVMSRNASITARVSIEDLLAQLDAREKDQSAGSILEGKIIRAGDGRFGEPDTYSAGL
jgi:phage terminase small subunit